MEFENHNLVNVCLRQMINPVEYLMRFVDFNCDQVTRELAEFVRQRINSDENCSVANLCGTTGPTLIRTILLWVHTVLDLC